jgi:hypothetical protein
MCGSHRPQSCQPKSRSLRPLEPITVIELSQLIEQVLVGCCGPLTTRSGVDAIFGELGSDLTQAHARFAVFVGGGRAQPSRRRTAVERRPPLLRGGIMPCGDNRDQRSR